MAADLDPTADLLRAVADRIAVEGQSWDQAFWQTAPNAYDAGTSVVVTPDKAVACPTTACVSGWAIALAGVPEHLPVAPVWMTDFNDDEYLPDETRAWSLAGAALLGLSPRAAVLIFTDWTTLFPDDDIHRPESMPALLRVLADLPPEQRTRQTVLHLAEGE